LGNIYKAELLGKSDFRLVQKKLYDGLIENGYKRNKSLCFTCDGGHKNFLLFHRNPFDRILVATAIWENMPMLTNDSQTFITLPFNWSEYCSLVLWE
jgi:hypothetical protein